MPAWEMAEKIKTQEFTSLEITEILIERIEKINPIINAYCTPTFDLAREMAKNADDAVKKGEKLGLLHGIPISIKDDTLVKGVRYTAGCKLFENIVAPSDEVVVERLKNSGAVILGKTNLPTLGSKPITDNLIFGATKNPWDLTKTPGGSSGGAAAAVASGLCYLALGSDAGGSIRVPSAFCGVYGLKPNYGRVPQLYLQTSGILGNLCHKGPITRYVKDGALMLDVIAGEHYSDRDSLPTQQIDFFKNINNLPKNLKIGYLFSLGHVKVVDNEIEKSVLDGIQKFEQLDCSIEKTRFKQKNIESTLLTIWIPSITYPLDKYLKNYKGELDPMLIEGIKMAKDYTSKDIIMAGVKRENLYAEVCKLFNKYDLLITPTCPYLPFELGKLSPNEDEESTMKEKILAMANWIALTCIFNISGHPAASIPCGWSRDGLPIGMQIIGNRFDELTVLQVSRAFEEIQPWQDKKPQFN